VVWDDETISVTVHWKDCWRDMPNPWVHQVPMKSFSLGLLDNRVLHGKIKDAHVSLTLHIRQGEEIDLYKNGHIFRFQDIYAFN